MKKGQNTRGYARYIACDIHREYILVGGQKEDQAWVLAPRRVSIEKFPEWAKNDLVCLVCLMGLVRESLRGSLFVQNPHRRALRGM